MKVSSLLNLIGDSSDLLDFFARIETEEQLVSRLERLKRQGTEDLLGSIEALRISIEAALSDTLETSPYIGPNEEDEDEDEDEDDIDDLDLGDADLDDETQTEGATQDPNSTTPAGPEESKS